MSKNRIRFGLLFVFAIGLFIVDMGVSFAMLYKPIAKTECHNLNNDLEKERIGASLYGQKNPFKRPEYGHRYTCNGDPGDIEELSGYCKRESNSISDWLTGSGDPSCGMKGLSCHICVCEGNEKNKENNSETKVVKKTAKSPSKLVRCCREDKIDPVSKKCCDKEDGGFSNEDPDCERFLTKKDDKETGTITNQNGNKPKEEPKKEEPKKEEPKKEDCKIKDSKGECCKKIYYDLQLQREACCEGILLSTNVPFIGQCVVFKKNKDHIPEAGLLVDEDTAFPVLMGGISKIMVSVIILTSFVGILIGGVMIAAAGKGDAKKGKQIIGNVISALALLGASGVILHLINPNFFG